MRKEDVYKKGGSNRKKLVGKTRKGKTAKDIPVPKVQLLAFNQEEILESYIRLTDQLEKKHKVKIRYNIDAITCVS